MNIGEAQNRRLDQAAQVLCDLRGLRPTAKVDDPCIKMTNLQWCRKQLVVQYELNTALAMAGFKF